MFLDVPDKLRLVPSLIDKVVVWSLDIMLPTIPGRPIVQSWHVHNLIQFHAGHTLRARVTATALAQTEAIV